MNKIYYAILFVMVMVLAGCQSQPSELGPAIQRYMNTIEGQADRSFTITSAQKGNIPSNSIEQMEEVWCVTISSAFIPNLKNYIVGRIGLNWQAFPQFFEEVFLEYSCTNFAR
jgi:hypothetical protein